MLGAPAGGPALRSRVGYVTQAPSVYGDLSVSENLRYFARIVGVGRRASRRCSTGRARPRAAPAVGSLSGGERARVSLADRAARAVRSCSCSTSRRSGWTRCCAPSCGRMFHALAAEGTTLLVSSHVMDEAAECDALLLMREGAMLG